VECKRQGPTPEPQLAVVQMGERDVDDPHAVTDFYAARTRAASAKAIKPRLPAH